MPATMTEVEVLRRRMLTQHLSGPPSATPAGVVRLLTAVQAQERDHAFWSLGMRCSGATMRTVRASFDQGHFLRTHVLRQTWHLVDAADIRWLLALTSSRVELAAGSTYRKFGLDEALRGRATEVLLGRLSGGRCATRPELAAELAAAGLPAEGIPLAYLLMHAELRGDVCSGPIRGTQHTYAVLDERVPAAPELAVDEALGRLAGRFVTGHGPASLADLARWASLTVAQSRRALAAAYDMHPDGLAEVDVGGEPHFLDPSRRAPTAQEAADVERTAYLVPLFDELTHSYPRVGFPAVPGHPFPPGMDSRQGPVLSGLRDIGIWKRTLVGSRARVESQLAPSTTYASRRAVDGAEHRLLAFLERDRAE